MSDERGRVAALVTARDDYGTRKALLNSEVSRA